MSYFSIDESIENIKNPYTKELFKEVHSSYTMGNYRSATVMLWSVVVTDLVSKLNDLDSIYNDPKALQILNESISSFSLTLFCSLILSSFCKIRLSNKLNSSNRSLCCSML